jgi:hypothetical protein
VATESARKKLADREVRRRENRRDREVRARARARTKGFPAIN